MTEEPENLVLELLRCIRADIERLRLQQEETNLKIETLAGGMVSMKSSVESMRLDIQMIALAVDGHAGRLDKIENSLDALRH